MQDGQRVPAPGKLYYRGIELTDIVEAHRKAGTFGFEDVYKRQGYFTGGHTAL